MRWYVYYLVDPRTGEVFYVGKGTGSRVRQHEVEARKGVTSPKCNRIRQIWSEKLPVERRIVKLFEYELDALDFERSEIKRFGKSLTNLSGFGSLPIAGEVIRFIAWIVRISDGFKKSVRLEFVGENLAAREVIGALNTLNPVAYASQLLTDLVAEHGAVKVSERFKDYGIVLE